MSKSKKLKEHITPITDGDTRPDQVIGSSPKEIEKETRKKNADVTTTTTTTTTTTNRKGDVNSLEDYKDAI
jgi:hypothetical protein